MASSIPRWLTCPQTVTHPGSNYRARCRWTTLIWSQCTYHCVLQPYRVAQIKRHHFTFLLVTTARRRTHFWFWNQIHGLETTIHWIHDSCILHFTVHMVVNGLKSCFNVCCFYALFFKFDGCRNERHWCLYWTVSVRGSKPGKNVQLLDTEIRSLCLKSREIFLNQPVLLELEAPLKICGRLSILVESLLVNTAFKHLASAPATEQDQDQLVSLILPFLAKKLIFALSFPQNVCCKRSGS